MGPSKVPAITEDYFLPLLLTERTSRRPRSPLEAGNSGQERQGRERQAALDGKEGTGFIHGQYRPSVKASSAEGSTAGHPPQS